jgi:hypothetical protein
MYILVGEFEGDYGDYYERPVETIACSNSREKLEIHWESIKDQTEYIDSRIEEAPLLD